MLYGQTGNISPGDRQALQIDLQGELEAVQRYGEHAAATANSALQRLWLRIRHDEARHAHWLQMALAGRIPGAGMMGQGGMMGQMGAFAPGTVVVPTVAHMPEHANRAARVVEAVQETPYVLDFGDGKPHRWYVQSELRAAPAGTRAGQQVPGATTQEYQH